MDGVYIYMCKQIDCVFTFIELWLFLHVFTWLCLILMKLQQVMYLYCYVEFNNCKQTLWTNTIINVNYVMHMMYEH